jgi:two-component system cell cycle response regulator DivK
MSEKTILIVEDSEFNRRLLEAVLAPHHYRLLVAEDGESGVDLAQAEQPDLILMDVLLPGIDGYEATRHLRADPATRGLVIVALTASSSSEEQELALASGCDGYIPKPIDTRAFPEQIRRFLPD